MGVPVAIVVDGVQFDNWIEYAIESDIMVPADAFSFSLSNDAGSMAGVIKKHKKIEVLVAGTLQMTGYVDEVNYDVDPSRSVVEVVGRDLFGQLIDSCATPQTINSADIRTLAELLGPPHVPVWDVHNEENRTLLLNARKKLRSLRRELDKFSSQSFPDTFDRALKDQDLKKAVEIASANLSKLRQRFAPRIKIEPGDTVMDVLTKHATRSGFLIWLSADGKGVIAKPNYDQRPRFALFQYPPTTPDSARNNIKKTRVTESGREQYSNYRIVGTTGNTLANFAGSSRFDTSESSDGTELERTLIEHKNTSQSLADAKEQLQNDIARRDFEALEISYTVAGHVNSGELWQIDSMVSVDDQVTGHVGNYYLTRRRFVGNGEGQTTELTLRPAKVLLA